MPMREEILSSDNINYKDIFPYTFTIIERDDVLNAFANTRWFYVRVHWSHQVFRESG